MITRPLCSFGVLLISIVPSYLYADELGSIAPVTLALTVTSVTGGFPDADKNGSPDFEKSSSSDTTYTYEFKSKFVTSKITNASLINSMAEAHVIPNTNYKLVIAFDREAFPIDLFLIPKDGTTSSANPIHAGDYIETIGMATFWMTATTHKSVEKYNATNNTITPSNYWETFSVEAPFSLRIQSSHIDGLISLNAKYTPANGYFLVSPSKISSIVGCTWNRTSTIKGSINISSSTPTDITPYLDLLRN